MLAPLFSKPQSSLSVQAKRLVAMRFLIYTGFQTSYFIGVIGTLTYADDASVVATSLAVLFMNVFVILGSFAGGAALDAWGPRHHFLLSIVGTVTTGAAIIAFGSATGIVLLGAVLLGFVMGFAQPIATSYPAYLTDDPVELKDINSAIAMFSNVSIIVGPTLGGFVAATASSRAVFVLMMLFTALALIAGWGFRPQASHVAGDADADSAEEGERAGQSPSPSASTRVTFATSIKTVFTNSVLALLFCIIFLSNFGYGAFDPLESFFYRDVLHVGVEWMGWLSSASGVGAVLGAVVALRLPPHLVNLKTLLMALMSVGLGSLLYVGTPYVGVALVGQIVLGVAWGVVNPLHNTIVQTTAPLEQLGRVNSVMGFGNMFAGVAPLAIAPWLAATFGVQQTLVGAGMVVTAVPAALLLFGRRHFDRAARQKKPSQHLMKIAILPKNVECCDALRLGPGRPSGSATTKGGQAPLWRSGPNGLCLGIPCTPFTNTPRIAAQPRKAPMDTTFSHIKAVFCDIDGTLLTSQHTVSPRTVAAIRALRERGVLFGLCTGRDAHATEAMYELWGIEGLVDVMVGCGGAEVIDRAHDINELSYPLPGETIARICEHMADLPATPVCPRDGVFYVPESNACVEHLSRVDGVPYQVVDFAEFLREPQPKVMFTMAPEVMPRVIERASTFADNTVKAAALQTTQRLYEFMDPRVSKTRGLVRVAELNDMELQNICVFGDADNDTCMVADAGVGVAMANGSDATRAAADFVTASNDKDGIAIFIEEHLL